MPVRNDPDPRPGRKRSESAHKAILEAAFELVEERGYRGTSIEAIAARAGVGKQTIYRWWSSRGALVMEAVRNRAEREVPIPDTGSLERDLFRFLRATFAGMRGRYGTMMRALMAEAQLDPAFEREFRETFIVGRRSAVGSMLERARSRIDPVLATDLLYGPMWYRLLVGHGRLDDAFARAIVKAVLRLPSA